MAVPKKRTGHSAQGHRRSNWKATKPEITVCKNCGQPVLAHTVCSACGFYKGKLVSNKAGEAVAEPVKEVKAKKAPKATEALTEEVKEKKATTKKATTAKSEKSKEEKKEKKTTTKKSKKAEEKKEEN